MKNISNITIGQNAIENWKILDNAKNDDYWFHLKNLPSPYVVCNDITKTMECAQLCKAYSKYKNFEKVTVQYTLCKNLSKGDTIGSVLFKKSSKILSIKC